MSTKKTWYGTAEHGAPLEGSLSPEFLIPEEYGIPKESICGPEETPLPPEVQGGGSSGFRKPKRRRLRRMAAGLLTLLLVGAATYSSSGSSSAPSGSGSGALTLRFHYSAEYGLYKEGWIDLGTPDTSLGRFYAKMRYRKSGSNTPIVLEGDIHPSDRSISCKDPMIQSARMYYDIVPSSSSSFSIDLPKGPDYHHPASGGNPSDSMEFAAWVIRDKDGECKELKGKITAKDVRDAIESLSDGSRTVNIMAAYRSKVVEKNDPFYPNNSPKYALILRANGGSFKEDGSDFLYIAPQSMEYSGQVNFFVEATCPKPVNGTMVFAGWYKDKACTGKRITYLNIFKDLKKHPYGAAPYAPIELYAKWVPAGASR